MKRLALLALLAGLAGCSRAGGTVLGTDPGGEAATPVKELKPAAAATVRGVMYEKCPAAGCWFMLRDKSGVIRIDTKAAGFTVTDVPLNAEMVVKGSLKDSGERTLTATGLRY